MTSGPCLKNILKKHNMHLWMHQISNLQFGRSTFDLGFLTSCQMNPIFQFCFGDSDQITGRLCKTSNVIDGFGDLVCSCVVFFFLHPFYEGEQFLFLFASLDEKVFSDGVICSKGTTEHGPTWQ